MFNPGTKFEYDVQVKRELVTTVGSNPTPFMLEFLNELGEKGELVLTVQETGEPSGISASNGQPIPYYVVTALVCRVKPETKEESNGQ